MRVNSCFVPLSYASQKFHTTVMAGIVPFPGGTPGRKQWNIKDKKFGRRLRSQLAEDGCPESQVVLAKQLLQEKSVLNINDNEENARLGVFWLIQASEQGNLEATDILRQCLETGEGITEHNYVDVKACLNTSQNEKLAKRAAREMFMSLSDGQDFITSEQLRKRMNKIDLTELPSTSKCKEGNQNLSNDFLRAEKDGEGDSKNSIRQGSDDDEISCRNDKSGWSTKEDGFGEKLTENHLESAASHYSKGELPLVQGVFALTDCHNRNLGHLNYFQRTLLHPFITVRQAHLKFLSSFSWRRRQNFLSFFRSSTFQLLTLLILYPVLSVENVLLFLPMCIYYGSFFFMIVSTLQMLQSQKEYTDFRVWSRLFLSYDRDGNLNTDDAEFEFCKKNLRPYGVYFMSLLLNLVVYPFLSDTWIPQSECAIVSFAFTFLTLYFFHEKTAKKIDFLILFSFAINVLAKYPYETDGVVRQTWRFLDIELPSLQSYAWPCYLSQIVGSGVEFCLNFRGVFYLLMPGIFFKMASRENWRGTYKVLIPHCVTLSWWQIAVFCCQGATLYGLLRSALALVGLVLFLPLTAIATTILPIVAIFKHFADVALTSKTGITIILVSIPIMFIYYKRQLNVTSNFVKMQVMLAVVSAAILLCPSINNLLNEGSAETVIRTQPSLTWEQYSSVCQKNTWEKRADAELQFSCVHLIGTEISWKGVVDNVKIIKVQNGLLKVLNNFPQSLKSKLLCYYGEPYANDCGDAEDSARLSLCKVLNQINSREKCHVNSWNKYEFEMSVKMNSDRWNSAESKIRLILDDSMKNFTLKIHPNDEIWFAGNLNYPESIGSECLMVQAEEIGCINCSDKNLISGKRQSAKFTGQYFAREIYNGFKRILNFVFNPVVNFR